MTTIEDRIVSIANYLPPGQRDELAAVLKNIVAMAVMAALLTMEENNLDSGDMIGCDASAARLMNMSMDAAMRAEPTFERVDFSDFIRAGRKGDA